LNLGSYQTDPGFTSLTVPPMPAVIFSADGLTSQTRHITKIITNGHSSSILWTEDINGSGALAGQDINGNGNLDQYPLPASFAVAGTIVGRVRIEQQDQRYTWLLTVRQSAGGIGSVDVVVYFNRPTDDLNEEALFPATFFSGS